MLLLLASLASAAPRVAIVPGCPSNADGTVSTCQWRRALGAARLWREGRVDAFIPSGAAVHNPFIEAEALTEALVALGVPRDAVHPEVNALHTDQNVAWSLEIADRLGAQDIVLASDQGHAVHGCALVDAWSDHGCEIAVVPYKWAYDQIRAGMPAVSTAAVSGWVPLEEREARIAAAAGERPRASSWWIYLGQILGPRSAISRPLLPPGGT